MASSSEAGSLAALKQRFLLRSQSRDRAGPAPARPPANYEQLSQLHKSECLVIEKLVAAELLDLPTTLPVSGDALHARVCARAWTGARSAACRRRRRRCARRRRRPMRTAPAHRAASPAPAQLMASGSSDLYRSCLGVAGLGGPAGLAPLLEAMAAAGVLRLARAAGAAGGKLLFVTDIERKGMAMCVVLRPARTPALCAACCDRRRSSTRLTTRSPHLPPQTPPQHRRHGGPGG